jgi:peptide/nickel transport system substrate-binding protein
VAKWTGGSGHSLNLVPVLRKARDVVVDIVEPFGLTGLLCINHLFPPFNDVRVRRAILAAMSQEEYMRAYVGDDNSMWKPMPGFFVRGSPFYNEEGGEILKGPCNLDAARKLLVKSGYSGEPVTVMAAQDIQSHKTWGDVTMDLLNRLG